ncbi:O-antigen polymerase [Flavobacterium faecale]|uniref:O-antigen polymerase n=1 Tax=Flavobacterium faecale TaxID=1355330 RepID=UPI003AAF9833
MEIFINLLFLSIGFFFITRRQKVYSSLVNHFTIFGFVWPFITVGTQLAYPKQVAIEVVIFYYICWFAYIFGSSLFKHNFSKVIEISSTTYSRIKILIIFLFLFCIISNWELLSLILNIGNLLAWAALRKENGFEDLDSNIFFTLFQRVYLVFIPLGIFLFKNQKISKIFLSVLIFSGFIFSILKFTRAPILNLFIVLLVSYVYIYKKKLPLFSIMVSVLIIFLIFGGSMLILTKDSSGYNLVDDINLYLFGGQVAYQDFFDGSYIDNMRYDINNYSLDFVNYILKKVGFIDTYPSYVREYTNNPIVITNIYTFLDAFTYDLGIVGALIGAFVMGLFSDYSYRIYNSRRNIFALVFYGYICYFNCFVFANNEFIRFPVLLTAVSLIFYNFLVKIKYEK